ncbi:MAG TPA: hypothetical protein VM618_06605 [Acidimicrobiia bacterium]|nr:hypothetical protein [Acidimicrobiia bacterium]
MDPNASPAPSPTATPGSGGDVRRLGTVAAAVALLLVAALVALSALTASETSSPRRQAGAADRDGGSPRPATIVEPPNADPSVSTTPAPGGDRASPFASLEGRARSVVVSGSFQGLSTVTLRSGSLEAVGDAVDGSGRAVGHATVRVGEGDVAVAGEGLSLGVSFARLTPDGTVVVDSDLMPDSSPAGDLSISSSGATLTLSGPKIEIERVDTETEEFVTETVPGPVTVRSPAFVTYSGSEVVWLDPPERMKATVGWVSWAGGGSIEFQGHRFEHEFLGARGDGRIELVRAAGAVEITGNVEARQIWTDGHARIQTDAHVDVKSTPGEITAGGSGWFTWAPTNGGDYDMAMHRIVPGNAEGHWVELALDTLPRMWGGEDRPPVGGDTTGLRYDDGGFFDAGTQPISSMLRPGKGDERDISVHVPSETAPGQYTVVLLVEGNFETVRVEIPVTVVAPTF